MGLKHLTVKTDTHMILGAPAHPMPRERSDALAGLVASIPSAAEAHLPQCFVIGEMEKPAQVLVIAFDSPPQHDLWQRIGVELQRILPGDQLDVWPVTPGTSMLAAVRRVGCQIYARPTKKAWWRFW